MQAVQAVGDPDMKVKRVGVLVGGSSIGFGGDEMTIRYMQKWDLDLIICGDIIEWSLVPYVRDATQLGIRKGMLVLGHERSEEPGMKYLPEWMKPFMQGTEVIFLDAKEPFWYLM